MDKSQGCRVIRRLDEGKVVLRVDVNGEIIGIVLIGLQVERLQFPFRERRAAGNEHREEQEERQALPHDTIRLFHELSPFNCHQKPFLSEYPIPRLKSMKKHGPGNHFPARMMRNPYPLTAPAVMPEMMCFWQAR